MSYDNTSRAAAARTTGLALLAAARASFLTHGYAGTTVRAVAQAAGVSCETVYKRFRSKAGLLKDVYDLAVAGDDEPVPVADRPGVEAVRTAADPTTAATAYARLAGDLTDRAGPLLRVALSARGSDPDLDAFVGTVDAERLAGAAAATRAWQERGWLRAGIQADRARDLLWTLNSPAVWVLLGERGWDRTGYERWITDGLLALLLDPDA